MCMSMSYIHDKMNPWNVGKSKMTGSSRPLIFETHAKTITYGINVKLRSDKGM